MLVFQLNDALAEYGCTICQVVEPGRRIQNWYRGLAQPGEPALKVTAVPATCGEPGLCVTEGVTQGPRPNEIREYVSRLTEAP